jgi:rhodanese-related sulfurtransferase
MQPLKAPAVRRTLDDDPDAVIINVLDEEEFRKHHIPGSKNVPLDAPDFNQRIDALTSGKDEPVVVYCASTDCPASEKAAERLEKAGFTRVLDFEGGMEEWEKQGYPVESGAAISP